jgi:molecular chaperone HscB
MPLSQPQTKRAEGVPVTSCWNCKGAVSGTHFCGACGKIQPLPAGMDYFAFFGLPRKLTIEPEALDGQFHMLSWKLHPDNFVRASEFERNLSLQRSSELNDAYRTLREPLSRVEYLLEFLNVRKEGTTKQQAPPELLEEVFELNEWLDELRETRTSGGEVALLRGRLDAAAGNFQAKLTEVDAELAALGAQWDAALDSGADEAKRTALLTRMSEVLNRRSYIRNLVDGVQQEIAAA